MRRTLCSASSAAVRLAAAGVLLGLWALPAPVRSQQQDSSKPAAQAPGSSQPSSQASSTPATQSYGPQAESLGEAARRAREQKKEAAKPARVFDNDNIPEQGNISTVGTESEPASGDNTASNTASGEAPAGGATAAPGDEKAWRERFAKLRDKLATDQHELEVMQRELSVLDVVNYPDPLKTLQQETTRGDINKKTADIEKQKKKIEADKQAIADAEDELRKSGGDSGWAR
jgi:chromosome segregation ATPase